MPILVALPWIGGAVLGMVGYRSLFGAGERDDVPTMLYVLAAVAIVAYAWTRKKR